MRISEYAENPKSFGYAVYIRFDYTIWIGKIFTLMANSSMNLVLQDLEYSL